MGTKNNTDIIELSKIVSSAFVKIEPGFTINTNEIYNFEEFKKVFTEKVKFLLETRFDQLINLLYMIDIEDRKIEELFLKKDKENIPESLVNLIIERQLQKIYYRKIYKEGKI